MVRQKTLKDETMKTLIKYLPDEDRDIAPIVKIYDGYIVLAQNKKDFEIKCVKISRGDVLGFYRPKPYVLTQDIKVGDDVFFADGSKKTWTFAWEDQSKKYSMVLPFKILGEVSPKATFVKDGEEYEVKQHTKSVEKEVRQCDDDYEWEVNSGNSDAKCFNKKSLRNTKVCNDCPYNDLSAIVEIEEIRYKVKCPCCGDFK